MAHEHVYGFCDAKCKVEVDTKANTDVVKNKVSTLESNVSTLSSSVGGFDSRIKAVENEVNGALNCTSVTASGKITGNGGIAGTTGTFSGAVTASKLKQTSVTTVTSGTPPGAPGGTTPDNVGVLMLYLPYNPAKYSGSINVKSLTSNNNFFYRLGLNGAGVTFYLGSNETKTISFSNVDQVMLWNQNRSNLLYSSIGSITLS